MEQNEQPPVTAPRDFAAGRADGRVTSSCRADAARGRWRFCNRVRARDQGLHPPNCRGDISLRPRAELAENRPIRFGRDGVYENPESKGFRSHRIGQLRDRLFDDADADGSYRSCYTILLRLSGGAVAQGLRDDRRLVSAALQRDRGADRACGRPVVAWLLPSRVAVRSVCGVGDRLRAAVLQLGTARSIGAGSRTVVVCGSVEHRASQHFDRARLGVRRRTALGGRRANLSGGCVLRRARAGCGVLLAAGVEGPIPLVDVAVVVGLWHGDATGRSCWKRNSAAHARDFDGRQIGFRHGRPVVRREIHAASFDPRNCLRDRLQSDLLFDTQGIDGSWHATAGGNGSQRVGAGDFRRWASRCLVPR